MDANCITTQQAGRQGKDGVDANCIITQQAGRQGKDGVDAEFITTQQAGRHGKDGWMQTALPLSRQVDMGRMDESTN